VAWKLPQFEEMKHPRGAHGTFTFKSLHTKKTKSRKRKMHAIASPAKRRFKAQTPFKKTGPY
jgi:hypothetical protein